VKCTRPTTCLPQSAWSPCQVQQQNSRVQFGGSGSRVAVPGTGGSSVKRGCGGTGVFLPRHYETTPSEPRKKTGEWLFAFTCTFLSLASSLYISVFVVAHFVSWCAFNLVRLCSCLVTVKDGSYFELEYR